MPHAPHSSPETTRATAGTPSLLATAQVVSAATAAVSGTAPPMAAATTAVDRAASGPQGPDPTRYGDWERAGRCIDF